MISRQSISTMIHVMPLSSRTTASVAAQTELNPEGEMVRQLVRKVLFVPNVRVLSGREQSPPVVAVEVEEPYLQGGLDLIDAPTPAGDTARSIPPERGSSVRLGGPSAGANHSGEPDP